MGQQIRRNEDARRYELVIDDELVGIADYSVNGSVVVLPHTEIEPSQRGRGLGAVLVKGVLDDVRAQGRTVVPTCWYVRDYIREHPVEADLLAH
jgi:predicted GNAT family acetyltransferase